MQSEYIIILYVAKVLLNRCYNEYWCSWMNNYIMKFGILTALTVTPTYITNKTFEVLQLKNISMCIKKRGHAIATSPNLSVEYTNMQFYGIYLLLH